MTRPYDRQPGHLTEPLGPGAYAAVLRQDPTDTWELQRPTRAEDVERTLRAAVLDEACRELTELARARRTDDRPHVRIRYAQLRAWFLSPDRDWPYSMLNLCDALGLEPGRWRRWAAAFPEDDVRGLTLPEKYAYGLECVDWRDPRTPIVERVWAWALEQPGPWRVRDLRQALGIEAKEAYNHLRWPTQTGRLRVVGPGVREVVRQQEPRRGVG